MSALVDESLYTDAGTTGTAFKWDSTSSQYTYNWSTKGLAAGYWYKLSVKLDDGSIQIVSIGRVSVEKNSSLLGRGVCRIVPKYGPKTVGIRKDSIYPKGKACRGTKPASALSTTWGRLSPLV